MPNTTNYNWDIPADTDLVKDGAAAMRTLGNSIDTTTKNLNPETTLGDIAYRSATANTNTRLPIGTNGQILTVVGGVPAWSSESGDISEVVAGTGISGGGTSGSVTVTNSMATTIDAKGDLIVGTGDNAFARLGVGSNGETLVADSSTTTGLRYNPPVGSLANPIINGGFDIWQRGTSISLAASSANIYTADRWNVTVSANQASTVSRQTISDATNLPNIQYSLRFQRNSGQTGTAAMGLVQNIETANSIPFAGKTVTLSFYARAGANFSPAGSALRYLLFSGTGTDQNRLVSGFTGETTPINNATATLTTTWQRFTATATIPTNCTELAVYFAFDVTGTAGANDWFEVTGVQLDVGTWTASTAPTFRRSGGTLAGELAAAMRYYQRFSGTSSNPGAAGYGYAQNTGTVVLSIPPMAPMRTTPSSLDYSGLLLQDNLNNTIGSFTSVTLETNVASPYCFAVSFAKSPNFTAGRTYRLIGNSSSDYIGFSAEL